jgi:hypothetical protein
MDRLGVIKNFAPWSLCRFTGKDNWSNKWHRFTSATLPLQPTVKSLGNFSGVKKLVSTLSGKKTTGTFRGLYNSFNLGYHFAEIYTIISA